MGILYVVATPIGNLNDFSFRAIETLKSCEYILAEDTRQTLKLLNHFDIKNKLVSYHKFNETKRAAEVINDLKVGKNIALVSDAGTPCVSDPGYILVKQAKENGIIVNPIPGCCALIAALSVSGLDSSSFTFYGFVPTENKLRKDLFESIKHSSVKTKIVYESPKRIKKLLLDIGKEIPGCAVCVCSELTKIHEKETLGIIEDVTEVLEMDTNLERGEYVVLISNEPEEKNEVEMSIEALLVDKIIKHNCNLKEAMKLLMKEKLNLNRNDVYKALLNLKKISKN